MKILPAAPGLSSSQAQERLDVQQAQTTKQGIEGTQARPGEISEGKSMRTEKPSKHVQIAHKVDNIGEDSVEA